MLGGERPTFASVRVLAAAAVSLTLVVGVPAPARPCEPPATVDLITGASDSAVRGVVEYEVIAENRSGLGKSVGATRRIWGDVAVDRWMVTPSRSDCATTPTARHGDRWYVLIRSGEGDLFGTPSANVISDLESGALSSIVGEPVAIQIGSVDRAMAWMRVNWWLVLGASVPVVVVGAVVARRRAGARRDYLF